MAPRLVNWANYLQDSISNTAPATRNAFVEPMPSPGAPSAGVSGVSNCRARARLSVGFAGPCAYRAICTEEPAETWKSRSEPLNVNRPLFPATALSILPSTPAGLLDGMVRSAVAHWFGMRHADVLSK